MFRECCLTLKLTCQGDLHSSRPGNAVDVVRSFKGHCFLQYPSHST